MRTCFIRAYNASLLDEINHTMRNKMSPCKFGSNHQRYNTTVKFSFPTLNAQNTPPYLVASILILAQSRIAIHDSSTTVL